MSDRTKHIKNPLFKKENKNSLSSHYNVRKGGDFRHTRNTKKQKEFEGSHQSMKAGQFGYCYKPLFKFLLSKVGQKWDEVYAEAKSRLLSDEPIFWMVETNPVEIEKYNNPSDNPYNIIDGVFRSGEDSNYSTLIIDSDGILQLQNPEMTAEKFLEKYKETFLLFNIVSFNGVGYVKTNNGWVDNNKKGKKSTNDLPSVWDNHWSQKLNDRDKKLQEQAL